MSDSNHQKGAMSRRKLLTVMSTAAAGWMIAGTPRLEAAAVPAAAGSQTPVWLNVKTYGAQGNGYQDDLQAFRSVIEAANRAGGGVVYVPPGRYMLSGPIPLGSNIRLVGDGPGSSVLKGIRYALPLLSSTGGKRMGVQGIGFEGIGTLAEAKTFEAAEKAIHLADCEEVLIENCAFSAIANGIWLAGSRHVTVRGCFFHDILASSSFYEGYGIAAEGGAHLTISANRFRTLQKPAVYLYAGCSSSTVEGNLLEESRDAFIVLSSSSKACSHNRIADNTVTAAGLTKDQSSCTQGIVLRGYCMDNTVTGNDIAKASEAGIVLEGDGKSLDSRLSGTILSGNRIDSVPRGLILSNADGTVVTGNVVRRAEVGILLEPSASGDGALCRYNLVTGNMLMACTKAGIQLAAGCEDTVVAGNNGTGNAEAVKIHEQVKVQPGF
ncbi:MULTISPECIES: right-handed parallel beta-helix repeat-containing protein [Paenibacillus]|uniref:right-handed parallel beta-helix repeat-containing protein n=1 Tax=Paenibacillus TaxID=44249 RepID=UPI0022B8951A|nr:right-handed parallel beta-helix repeat-containing protein [Paenibacillus caseinilyticus]MCZ8520184.1 right-handed parallel beta-helix repeat-containing protein [Paenibacillus caseinilyticus]